jgi:tetratricopeptide (TPR) repeat protein
LAAVALRGAARKQASDIVYRAADEARQRAFALAAQGAPSGAFSPEALAAFQAADERFQTALRLWPDHHNCRSAYSEMLVRQGRGREALEQIDRVMRRLNAWELPLRRARALWLMGEREAARREARQAFEIKPVEALLRPRAAAWARGEAPATDDLAGELDIAPP